MHAGVCVCGYVCEYVGGYVCMRACIHVYVGVRARVWGGVVAGTSRVGALL